MKLLIAILFFLVFCSNSMRAQQRPFIWVNQLDREQVLEKILREAWAKSSYDNHISNLKEAIAAHQNDADKFLRSIPLDWDNQKPGESPPFFYTTHIVDG